MLRLHTKFQCSTMPGTGLKVCGGWYGGWVVWWCKPILVFSLGQAEQYNIYWPNQWKWRKSLIIQEIYLPKCHKINKKVRKIDTPKIWIRARFKCFSDSELDLEWNFLWHRPAGENTACINIALIFSPYLCTSV